MMKARWYSERAFTMLKVQKYWSQLECVQEMPHGIQHTSPKETANNQNEERRQSG